jgi:hypothetical protein
LSMLKSADVEPARGEGDEPMKRIFFGLFMAWSALGGCGQSDEPSNAADYDHSVRDASTDGSSRDLADAIDTTPSDVDQHETNGDVGDEATGTDMISSDALEGDPGDRTVDWGDDPQEGDGDRGMADEDSPHSVDPDVGSEVDGDGSYDGGLPEFPDILRKGIWLIGWHGDVEHFSWVRFDFVVGVRGSIEVRDPGLGINPPFFPCEGTGLFSGDSEGRELVLQAPVCEGEVDGIRVAWGAGLPVPELLPSALAAISLSDLDTEDLLLAYLFPFGFCDADFTSCGDPFGDP